MSLLPLPEDGGSWIAGVDEVGRGSLFGPVVAAAVILPYEATHQLISLGVQDSKQLSARQREALYPEITAIAVDCKIAIASVAEIDRLNILQATLLAMHRAIHKLVPLPSMCLIDGNQRIPNLMIPQQTIVKGDQTSCEIAAASIVAKVWRDRLIVRLAQRYPGYDLAANKGYGSQRHRAALLELGVSAQHRRSFRTCQAALDIIPGEASKAKFQQLKLLAESKQTESDS